jgi:hypothetical protein
MSQDKEHTMAGLMKQWVTHNGGILAHQVGEVSAQLLNGRNSTKHRLSSRRELQNSLVTLTEESSVLILQVDDGSRASLVDRSRNEDHRQQGSMAAAGGHGQIELGHFVLLDIAQRSL